MAHLEVPGRASALPGAPTGLPRGWAIERPHVVTCRRMTAPLRPKPDIDRQHAARAIAAALAITACGGGSASDAGEGSGGTCDCPGQASEGSAASSEPGASTGPDDTTTGECDDDCTSTGGEPPVMCDVTPPDDASSWIEANLPHGLAQRPGHHWPTGFRDVDGDGHDDVLLRTFTPDAPTRLAVVFGPVEPGDVDVAARVDRGGGFWIVAAAESDVESAEIAGDRDGDGMADIFVSSTTVIECTCGDDECYGSNEHTIHAVRGKADTATIELDELAEPAGFAIGALEVDVPCGVGAPIVSALGDVDGDGRADAVVRPSSSTAAWLPGTVDTSMDLAALDTSFAPSAPAGDVDGDGIADFVMREDGQVSVRLGAADPAGGTLAYAIQTGGLDGFSALVVAVGDVDGDGVPDLATGPYIDQGPPSDGLRRTFVVFGRTDGAVVSATDLAAGEGGFMIGLPDAHVESIVGPGDYDGDGLADIALGISHHVFVVPGKADGAPVSLGSTDVITIEVDDQPCAQHFGRVLWAPGDVHGDGTGDLMAPLYDSLVVLDGDG